MPGHGDEAESIFGWLAEAISRDTYVNIMDQYRPTYEVGATYKDGSQKYRDIGRRPDSQELANARAAARAAGLWRIDERW